jgi:hypothetical protein
LSNDGISVGGASAPESRVERWLLALYRLALTAWVGCTWTVGLLAAPLAFAVLTPRSLAGTFASHAFYWQSIVVFVCAAIVLALHKRLERRVHLTRVSVYMLLSMVGLAAIQQFVLGPWMASLRVEMMMHSSPVMQESLATQFGALHGVSAVLYAAQCVLGAIVVARSR